MPPGHTLDLAAARSTFPASRHLYHAHHAVVLVIEDVAVVHGAAREPSKAMRTVLLPWAGTLTTFCQVGGSITMPPTVTTCIGQTCRWKGLSSWLLLVIVHSSTAPAVTCWSIRAGSKARPSMVKADFPSPCPSAWQGRRFAGSRPSPSTVASGRVEEKVGDGCGRTSADGHRCHIDHRVTHLSSRPTNQNHRHAG